jgi:hypothetical protein
LRLWARSGMNHSLAWFSFQSCNLYTFLNLVLIWPCSFHYVRCK